MAAVRTDEPPAGPAEMAEALRDLAERYCRDDELSARPLYRRLGELMPAVQVFRAMPILRTMLQAQREIEENDGDPATQAEAREHRDDAIAELIRLEAATPARTELDACTANIDTLTARINADPTGTTARAVRDILRRAHERGVRRNFVTVLRLLAALPDEYLQPLTRQADTRPAQRLYRAALRVSGRIPDDRPRPPRAAGW